MPCGRLMVAGSPKVLHGDNHSEGNEAMTAFYLNMKNAIEQRREEGQGTIEYIGIAVVVAIILSAILIFMSDTGADSIRDGVSDIIDGILGRSPGF